jgi:hypothetical protein
MRILEGLFPSLSYLTLSEKMLTGTGQACPCMYPSAHSFDHNYTAGD